VVFVSKLKNKLFALFDAGEGGLFSYSGARRAYSSKKLFVQNRLTIVRKV